MSFAYRGASLTIIEATSVLPNGRISPEDSGLWTDSQIGPIRRLADFLHSLSDAETTIEHNMLE
jgi:2,4-dienoyl-CoA reductase-like NADH-dependent reductase (Old Yellow Enzyme family)